MLLISCKQRLPLLKCQKRRFALLNALFTLNTNCRNTLSICGYCLVRSENNKKARSLHLKMCDLHCEQHSSARDNRTFSKGGGAVRSTLPPPTTYPSATSLSAKTLPTILCIIFNTLMNADYLIIKLHLALN